MTVEVIKAEVATVSHQEEKMKAVDEVVEVVELQKDVEEAKPESVEKTPSFKEESNFVSDLKDHEKKALTDLKAKLEEAILGNTLFKKDEPKVEEVVVEKKEEALKEEVVEEVKEKEVDKVEEKEKVEGEESSKKSGEKKGWVSTIQEAFKGHGLFKKEEVKVEEVVEEKAKVEEEKKEEEKKEECVEEKVVKVEEDVEVKEGDKVEEKEKLVEAGEESSKKSGEKKGLNKLKSKIGGLFKKDEPKVEEVVEEKPKVEEEIKEEEKKEEEKKEEEKKEECAEEVVQEDLKEKESETVEEKEKVEEVEESSKKGGEKKGLNKFKSTIQEAFKGHLFGKKSKKEIEEKKEELKPEVDDKVVEEPKAEGEEKVDAESKAECEEKKEEDVVEEKKEEDVVEVIKTEVCEEKEPEAVVEEVAEEIKTEESVEEKKVEEVAEACVEETKVEEVAEVCEEETKVEEVVVDKDISLWGVPLLPSKADEGTDVVLLKFLRARDFKVKEAFEMLKKTLEWRKEWKIDSILDEDFGTDLSSVAYMSGVDREGHPICYNIFGVLDDEELYQKTLGSEEKRDSFLRWRFQLMERGIQKLELKPTGVTSLLQITDLKNSPGPAKKEVRLAIKQALGLLQDNYPEFVAKNIFINVPFWYYAYNAVLSTLLTQRTKSKLVFARPAKVTETLLKFIPVEEIPIQYGGLKRDSDFEFSAEDCLASELVIKAASTATIEIPAPQAGTTFIWDITVLGWDVNYKEEFVPTDECSYTIIVQKQKKLSSSEGPIRNTFRTNEPGKIVLTIENCSNKKKKVFYRNKVKKSAF